MAATLAELAGPGLIAAGDYNETFADPLEKMTWGGEFRQRLADAGLSDQLIEIWGDERPTRWPPAGQGSPGQLDHVVTDAKAAALIVANPEPFVDEEWREGPTKAALSDHAPVWFSLSG